MLFEPVIMLCICIKQSTVKKMLLSKQNSLIFMYVNAYFNLSKLILLNSFSNTNVLSNIIVFATCYEHVRLRNNASPKNSFR